MLESLHSLLVLGPPTSNCICSWPKAFGHVEHKSIQQYHEDSSVGHSALGTLPPPEVSCPSPVHGAPAGLDHQAPQCSTSQFPPALSSVPATGSHSSGRAAHACDAAATTFSESTPVAAGPGQTTTTCAAEAVGDAHEVDAAAAAGTAGEAGSPVLVLTIVVDEPGAAAATALLTALRSAHPSAFLILWHAQATEDPVLRLAAFAAGANMVTASTAALQEALRRVALQGGGGALVCPWCGLAGLSERDLWWHQPLYHIYHRRLPGLCPSCHVATDNVAEHLHKAHHPDGELLEAPICTGSAIVVHRPRDHKFLMVQEYSGQGFWVPGGVLDPGESFRTCALRECLEEVGVHVALQGCLQVQTDLEHQPLPWRLVTFYGTALDGDAEVKTVPDFESAGSCWVSASDLDNIVLRDESVPRTWFAKIAQAGPGWSPPPLEVPQEYRALLADRAF